MFLATFSIEKKNGSYKWWLVQNVNEWPYKRNIRGFRTKRDAALFLKAWNGQDSESAKIWYRREIHHCLKKGFSETEAYRSAALSAKEAGMTPGFVGADPTTYEPIDSTGDPHEN
jgi:hypothetical protein